MERINDTSYIDDTLISCVEYQKFIDEMYQQNKYYQPDYWYSSQFSRGQAYNPVLGVRYQDAEKFCEWLTNQEYCKGIIRLPTMEDINKCNKRILGNKYWINPKYCEDDEMSSKTNISQKKISIDNIIDDDTEKLYLLVNLMNQNKQKPITAMELLERTPHIYTGSTNANRGITHIEPNPLTLEKLEYNSYEYKDRLFFNESTRISKPLDINIENQIYVFERYISAPQKEFGIRKEYRNWLRTDLTWMTNKEDIEDLCFELRKIITYLSTNKQIFSENESLIDITLSLINIIENRSWIKIDIKNTGLFLRWNLRLSVHSLLRMTIKYWPVNNSTVTNLRDVYINFLCLENERMFRDNLGLGIRIVKERII